MSSLAAAVPAERTSIYPCMDVHKDAMTTAVIPEVATPATRIERSRFSPPKRKSCMYRVVSDGENRVCHDASGTGYRLHRALRNARRRHRRWVRGHRTIAEL